MVQGGCERGNGSGSGPLPAIPGEFSESEAARHAYGTLSMARGNNPNSAGAQFFIICDDGRPAWSLDGKYASFGQVVEGTEALEAIASVPVTSNFQGEVSQPTQRIEIVSVQVQRGGLPDAIPIQQPDREQNREGWPNTVEVESLLVAVGGGLLPVERSLDEAMTLAQSLLQRAQGGEDFQSLVRQYSDDPSQQAHEDPVGYRFSDTGCSPKAGQREVFQLNNEYQEKFNELEHSKRNGILTSEQVAEQARGFQVEILRRIRKAAFIPREQRRALADPAFEMEVGEIKLVPRDPSRTLEGVYLLHRIR
jgi:cyclophilin family peptidyl-prolyl cis-trans isomerase